ncbi:MAG: VanZ family protein [Erysipelotrichaceae bacterium]|nr:VanZ family protein [Erysipelotrichaceae bacterium]
MFSAIEVCSLPLLIGWIMVYAVLNYQEAGLCRDRDVQAVRRKRKSLNHFMGVSLIIFGVGLVYLTLLSRMNTETRGIETDFLYELRLAFSLEDGVLELASSYWLLQTVHNILLFIPGGMIIPWWCRRMKLKMTSLGALACGFLISLCIETTQLVTATGIFEISDLMNNTLGFFIGFLFFSVVCKICRMRQTARNKNYQTIFQPR